MVVVGFLSCNRHLWPGSANIQQNAQNVNWNCKLNGQNYRAGFSADCPGVTTGEKSQQGIVVYRGITSNQWQGGNLVQWRSSRQDLIAKSTCEAELIASGEALQQGEAISIVISEMINESCDIEVSSDNAAALHMVRNGSETAWRTRHISVKALWMHQMARRGVKLTYQPPSEMAADSLN